MKVGYLGCLALAGLPRLSGPAEVAPTTLVIDPAALGHLDSRATLPPAGPLPSPREIEERVKPSLLDWARQKPVEAIAAAALIIAVIMALGAGLGLLAW